LEDVVAEAGNAREDIVRKFAVGPDAVLLGGHADVSFVNAGCFDLAGGRVFPLVVGLVDDLGGEGFTLLILHQKAGVGGKAIVGTVRPNDVDFVKVAVFESLGGKADLPDADLLGAAEWVGFA
jgi:hypothetical protein